MPRIETVYHDISGLDLREEPVGNFVTFIEKLTDEGYAFNVMQQTPDIPDESGELWPDKHRPVIGYGGERTFPFISDPFDNFWGTFAIIDRELIYAPNGIPLHHMRDSYTWAFTPYKYKINQGFEEVVKEFVDSGYPLLISEDMTDYRTDGVRGFTINGEITLGSIFKS